MARRKSPQAARQPPGLFLLVLALGLALGLAGCATETGVRSSPAWNVVVFLTDDQGAGDFGFQGNPVLDTPHLDALAAECPQVDRFYVNPVCSPTRASLLTGRWSQRTRVVDTWAGRSMMEPDEVTLAEVLSAAGYRTGIFGKWHLGDCYPMRPIDQGFDVSLVHRGGGLAQPSEPVENERRYTDPILFANGESVQTSGFCTDVFVDGALQFIDESLESGSPFFAYVATNAPHDPFHDVPPALYEKYRQRALGPALAAGADPDRVARVYAMVENIDQNVGRLREHLQRRGISDRTLFVFLNDNGPLPDRFNAGLRGGKTGVHEGGIRTPFLFSWPGQVSPTTRVTTPAAHVDLLPTLLDALQIEPPDVVLDGHSLLPWLTGAEPPPTERTLVLQSHRGDEPSYEHHFALVTERWKLLRASGFGRPEAQLGHPFELYDLQADPGEQHDLAATHPEIVARLRAAYAEWWRDLQIHGRPDPFAPPRIVVGTEHERRTVLTRQDWRLLEGGGFGNHGQWLLACERPTTLHVEIRLHEPLGDRRVVLRLGEHAIPVEPRLQGPDRFDLGLIPFPAGPVDFAVELRGDELVKGPYQVTLTVP